MVSEYDYWLFDLDGTVVDIEWSYPRETFDRVGDRLGHRFSDRQVELLWHGFGGSRDDLLVEWGVDPEAFWPAFHDVESPERRAEETYVHEDAARFISRLDCPVGVVTHCQRFLTDPILDHLDIRDWFDAVVCCSEELGWKPDPAPVERAIGDLDVDDGGRGALAGDGANDVGAAWNAGLDGVHVERHGDRRGHCVLGDYRVQSFDDLLSGAASGSVPTSVD